MNRSVRLLAAVLAFLAAGSASAAGPDPFYALVARYRESRGLPSLVIDETLEDTAQIHARYMRNAGILSHRNAAGDRAHSRYRLAGGTGTRTGEIIGAGRNWELLFHAWLNSAPHRAILEDPTWRRIGAGAVDGGPGLIAVGLFGNSGIRRLAVDEASGDMTVTVLHPDKRWEIRDISGRVRGQYRAGRLTLPDPGESTTPVIYGVYLDPGDGSPPERTDTIIRGTAAAD